jgi:hypothetical protein
MPSRRAWPRTRSRGGLSRHTTGALDEIMSLQGAAAAELLL